MIQAVNLGFPRIGSNRELKWALEAYWAGRLTGESLQATARQLRARHWLWQQQAGIDHIPSNDFSLYDHVLDTIALVGAVPKRFGWNATTVDLDIYFAMARGVQAQTWDRAAAEVPGAVPLEMTKWFDTNYHYLVPEFHPDQTFCVASAKPWEEYLEARALGIETRPVLLGPVTFLLLGRAVIPGYDTLQLLDRLLPVYQEVLRRLKQAGAQYVQMDEPCLGMDLSERARQAYQHAYAVLSGADSPELVLTTYFGGLEENLPLALSLPVAAVHLDLVRAPEQLALALAQWPPGRILSLGLVDGRNVWRTDLDAAAALLQQAVAALGPDHVWVGPSCSLLHVPVDLASEPNLDSEIGAWLAYARQKLHEVVALKRLGNHGASAVHTELSASRQAKQARLHSRHRMDPVVRQRLTQVTPQMMQRPLPFAARYALQRQRLKLPLLPSTTIGSFPQTEELRQKRAAYRRGALSREAYETFLEAAIAETIARQEALGLDVLVHGEPERTDMVEYFASQLQGFWISENGWVQSYGSRCVRPPVLYGDVARREPMTIRWILHAQRHTRRPVKGMLTGPVTMLQWSFVREDQPRADTCRQIALALRDEVLDLEAAGISVIQIDEPALREGLPLRRRDRQAYLTWAVECFRLTAGGLRAETQLHTHMCYADFEDILDAIVAMDADVISIEAARSGMRLLEAFDRFQYPNAIGPGVYDIHSPRVPTAQEIEALLNRALTFIPAERLWVNPDCGLKTRRWEEITPALQNMIAAARKLREQVAGETSRPDGCCAGPVQQRLTYAS
ncbi:MAG: 5-methyltetrahydropteroyltriglutamate--homocysteine S-methyltransferase [Verrucomicrobiota bacterium]|nr:5-methyltetrahydropteroyltriglutamate--homocysteine S-methyltransferase [Limisphaera sp.]MDW8382960.1 5-methyltetrahydropteroyltriglutamate--homocysteine S-methyltransferase [Verrucomicrobiota bacterium]